MNILLLRIENHVTLPSGGPVSLRLAGLSAQVGRRTDMDWVLPDSSRHISGHHFDITYRDGRYYISDLSANGTFRHGERYRLDSQHEIGEGDRYTVGHYIIHASFESNAALAQPAAAPPHHAAPHYTPAISAPQISAPQMPMPPSEADDDWADLTPMRSPDYGQSPQPAPASFPQMPPAPPQPAPPQPAPHDHGPLNHGWGAPAPNFQNQTSQNPPPPIAPPQAAPPATDTFMAAFLLGAGLPADTKMTLAPEDLGRMLGESLRVSTEEMMKMLIDRAAVKMFFSKEERTMLSASGNNPMKFMTDANAALTAMFLAPRDGYMTGPAGFYDALTDIRLHQAAVVGALQPALAQMMEGLSPEDIEDSDAGGRFGNKSKKNWEEYVKRWDEKAASGDHGMLDAFISAFARHYSDAKTKLTTGVRPKFGAE